MCILSLNVTIIEILALLLGAVILGGAIYFFQTSRRSLEKVLHPGESTPPDYGFDEVPVAKPQPVAQAPKTALRKLEELESLIPSKQQKAAQEDSPSPHNLHTLKDIIAEQQQLLTTLLERAEETEHQKLAVENEALEQKIADLELALEEKDQDIHALQQQVATAHKMTERIEEVYREFEAMQKRLKDVENQAGRARELEMEVADYQQEMEQLKKDILRKQVKLEETFAENQRLQHQLNEVEDKLAESNLQRQQLLKKVQYLQDLNTDFQGMADSNKRLQTELRRIGELESMLNMIAEERDLLLRKQQKH